MTPTPTGSPDPSPGDIAGVVRDRDSAPVPDVVVSIFRSDGAGGAYSVYDEDGTVLATSSDSGAFAFTDLEPGTYYLCFTSSPQSGFSSGCRTDEDEDGRVVVTPGTTAQVTRTAGPGHRIRGAVTSPDGAPIVGQVELFDRSVPGTWTSDIVDRSYTSLRLDDGEYFVCSGGFLTPDELDARKCYSTGDAIASAVAIDGADVDDVDLVVGPGSIIRGRVVGPDGEGIASAFVDVYPSGGAGQGAATSDGRYGEAGSFEVAGLEPGPATVCVQYRGDDGAYDSACYDGLPYDLDAPSGAVVDLPPRDTVELVIELPRNHLVLRPGGLVGTIAGAQAADERSGVEVTAYDDAGLAAGSDMSDVSGDWTIEDLPAGTYHVCFDATGTALSSECFDDQPYASDGANGEDVVVRGGQYTRVDSELAARSVRIAGRVTSQAGGALDDVAVVLLGRRYDQPLAIAETAVDGSYEFVDVPAGRRYVVCFEASGTGYVSECLMDQPFPERELERADLARELVTDDVVRDAVLDPGSESRAGVRGAVTDAQGHPVDGYVYVLDEVTGLRSSRVARTATDGSFVVGSVPDGRFQICVDTSLYDLPTGMYGYAPECWGDVPNFVAGHGAGQVLVTTGQVVRGVDFELGQGSALTVRVQDADGQPIDTYYAMGWDRVVDGAVTDTQETNGRLGGGVGVRRFADLPAGDYYVCVGDGRWYVTTSEFEDRCYAGVPAPTPYTWAGSGPGTGTAAAAASGATIVHLVPGVEQTITITLPRRADTQ